MPPSEHKAEKKFLLITEFGTEDGNQQQRAENATHPAEFLSSFEPFPGITMCTALLHAPLHLCRMQINQAGILTALCKAQLSPCCSASPQFIPSHADVLPFPLRDNADVIYTGICRRGEEGGSNYLCSNLYPPNTSTERNRVTSFIAYVLL